MTEFANDNYALIVADFQKIFGIRFEDVGYEFTWEHAYTLFVSLGAMPESLVGAKINDWDYPVSDAWIAVMNSVDAIVMGNYSGKGKKPKPMPRPWDRAEKKKRSKTVGAVDRNLSESERKQVNKESMELLQNLRSGKTSGYKFIESTNLSEEEQKQLSKGL